MKVSRQGEERGLGKVREMWVSVVVCGGVLLLVPGCFLWSVVFVVSTLPYHKKQHATTHNNTTGLPQEATRHHIQDYNPYTMYLTMNPSQYCLCNSSTIYSRIRLNKSC